MFKPVNRYILIDVPPEREKNSQSLIVLPDDYEPEKERYTTASVVNSADDVRFDLKQASKIVVDRSMVERIKIGVTNYDVILDNYVIGIVE
jgi:co-chaperonin GroES (HSP10)|tara:strand:- start:328 stop:600 length:273 start_codon:yes stop_codon:yes gene_type:complete